MQIIMLIKCDFSVLYMDNIPTWIALAISIGLGLLVALLTQLVVVPVQKRKISKQLRAKNPVKFTFADSVGGFLLKKYIDIW